jgi:hypothetical protein
MANARRAYTAWLIGRLSWLAPSFVLACVVFVLLVTDPELPLWTLFPFVALSAGAVAVILAFAVQTIRVVRERSRGRIQRAQLLRSELRASPGMSVALLFLLLGLLGVRFLFRESPPDPVHEIHRPSPTAFGKLPVEQHPAQPPVVPSDPPPRTPDHPVSVPDPVATREAAGTPHIVPEIARTPLALQDLELPTLPKFQDPRSSGEEEPILKHRPVRESDFFENRSIERTPFRRSGVPAEADLDSRMPIQLNIDLMVVSRSGPWRGGGPEIAFDLPVARDDAIRLTYTGLMLTNEEQLDVTEPSFTWHRGTLEYVRRIAGYTQHATFDLALRIGMTIDDLGTHEAGIRFDSSFRMSPWFGLETAVWEDHGVGLVAQIGHSPALRVNGASSRVTDFRFLLRIDLGEHSMLELGYRIVSVRFRDKLDADDEEFTSRFERSFMGPILGLAFRF